MPTIKPLQLASKETTEQRRKRERENLRDMPSKRYRMGHRAEESLPETQTPGVPVCPPHLRLDRDEKFCCIHLPADSAPRNEALVLLDFGKKLATTQCSSCKCYLMGSETLVKGLVEQSRPNGLLKCKCCDWYTCAGCGRSSQEVGPLSNDYQFCCVESCILCIWFWMCKLESIDQNRKENAKPKRKSSARRGGSHYHPPASTRKANGTGYGSDHSAYYGTYDSESDHSVTEPASHTPLQPATNELKPLTIAQLRALRARVRRDKPESVQDIEKRMFPHIFGTLGYCLKHISANISEGTAADKDSHEACLKLLYHVLAKSRAMETIATLLRNDNFEEMMSRHDSLYCHVFSIVQRLRENSRLKALVTGPRQIWSPSLFAMTTSRCEPKGQDATPIHEILEKLGAAASRLEQNIVSAPQQTDFEDDQSRTLRGILSFLRELGNAMTIEKQSRMRGGGGSGKRPEASEELSEAQKSARWHREHCIDAIEDADFERTLGQPAGRRFPKDRSRKAKETPEQIPVKGRMKRILTEITTLQSSLPEGIFVRYGSSRPDLMKVLIIGPRDTPYEQGLFEFDVRLPYDYPASPPHFTFMTTGGGRASFNPNLYPDGKVCLSLLGTWNGTPWDPSQSTLLQVLVSIQAMIFCSEPWYNEPGREIHETTTQSQKYNVDVQQLTIKHAMNEHLMNLVRSPDDVANKTYKEIKVKHFREHGPAILEKLKEWEKEAEKVKAEVSRPAHHPVAPPNNSWPVNPAHMSMHKILTSATPANPSSIHQDLEAWKVNQLQKLMPSADENAVKMPTMGLASSSTPATPAQDPPWATTPTLKVSNKDKIKTMQWVPGHQSHAPMPQAPHGQPSYAASHHKLLVPPAYTPHPVAESGMIVPQIHAITYVPHPFWATSPEKKALGEKLAALANKYQSNLIHGIYPTFIADGKLPPEVRAAVESVAQMRNGCALVWPDYVAASVPPYSAPSTPTEDEQADYWMTITQMLTQSETAPDKPGIIPSNSLQAWDTAVAASHGSQHNAHGSLPKFMSSYLPAPYGPNHSTPTTQTNPVSTNASFYSQQAPSLNDQFSAMSIQQPTMPNSQPLSMPFQQSIPLWQDWMKKKAQAKLAKLSQAIMFNASLLAQQAQAVPKNQVGAGSSPVGPSSVPPGATNLSKGVGIPSLNTDMSIPAGILDDMIELEAYLIEQFELLDGAKTASVHPTVNAIMDKKMEELITQANKNKHGHVFQKEHILEIVEADKASQAATDIDYHEALWERSVGKMELKKYVDEYEKWLKDFLRDYA